MKPEVVCVPGSVAPAAERYAPLKAALGDAAQMHLKDLEVYRDGAPPPDYAIEQELEAIDRFAGAHALEAFHLVGYSGGGFISLAYAATRPARVISLSLFEPARVPGRLSEPEQAFFEGLEHKLRGLEGPEFMSTFIREQVKPGAQLPPPPTSVSPEMRKRPAGIAAMLRAFQAYEFDRELLRAFPSPVYYAYGDLSHEEQALKAGVLAQLFPDIRVQRFAGVHHFVPAAEIYTARHAETLLRHWRQAEERAPATSR